MGGTLSKKPSGLGWRPRIGLSEGIAHTYGELLEARTLEKR